MSETETAYADFVVRMSKLFHRGIICPSEAWNQIGEATSIERLMLILDSLPQSDQEAVRGIHRKRPESLTHLAANDSRFQVILDWCLEAVD